MKLPPAGSLRIEFDFGAPEGGHVAGASTGLLKI